VKKKVLVYNYLFFELSETFIYLQAKLVSKYFDVSLVGYETKNLDVFAAKQLDIQLIKKNDPFFWRIMYKIIRRFGFHIPYEFVEKRMLKSIFRNSNVGLVHAHFGYNAVKILPIVKKFDIPLIVSFHGIDASKRIHHQPKYFRRLPELLDYASRIIVVSRHMTENLRVTAANRSKVIHLPYAVDAEYFNILLNTRGGDVVHILHSGRLVPKKGILDLIGVFNNLLKDFRTIQLHILGDGDDYQCARDLVDTYEIMGSVVFYGSQPQKKVKELMQMADIFVLNSRIAENGDMEGTPVSLLEAMSMGMAIVSTYHAGIPEVIQDGFNGLLVVEKNNDELQTAIKRLILDPSLRAFLAKNARKTVVEKFNVEILESELTTIYNSVLTD
jgi:colanic acid/amylovoran biosynthesis glycosyltransferase